MSRYGSRPPLFVLGAYPSADADGHACHCGRPATHFAAALLRGEPVALLVCSGHAERVQAMPPVTPPRCARESLWI